MPRGRKPIGERPLTSTERVHRARQARPRTEELYRAVARVLLRGIAEGWISKSQARDELLFELEGVWVGPSKRHLTKAEREALADQLLGEPR